MYQSFGERLIGLCMGFVANEKNVDYHYTYPLIVRCFFRRIEAT